MSEKTTTPQNVDPQEIAKFEALAHKWWDMEGEFKPLHEINPLRLDYIQQHCNGVFDKKIVDVGCGGGILSESLARLGADVTGIDMGDEPLQVARLHGLEVGIKVNYVKTTVENFQLDHPDHFDVVTCMEMLEHVPDPRQVIQTCAKLVKPGGKVFFSTLNKTFKSYLFAILGAEKVLKLVPEGTHDHEKFIRPSTLINWAEEAGLKAFSTTGLSYNPFNKTYKLSSDVDVNYIIACERV